MTSTIGIPIKLLNEAQVRVSSSRGPFSNSDSKMDEGREGCVMRASAWYLMRRPRLMQMGL